MLKRSLLVLAFASLPFTTPAFADDGCDGGCRGGRDRGHDRSYRERDHHRGWDRHDYRRSPRTRVSFNFGIAPYYPQPYYYRPTRVVYAVQPIQPQPQVVYINNDNSRVVDSNDGRYCREYQTNVRVGGVLQPSYGTACMNPDQSWEIVS